MTNKPAQLAYLIDAAAREVREVEYRNVQDLQSFVCGSISLAHVFPGGEVLFVDDEGLFKPQTAFFRVLSSGNPQPLAGNGVCTGREVYGRDGEYLGTEAPGMALEALERDIQWLTRAQADAWAKGNASEPACAVYDLWHDGSIRGEVLTTFGALWAEMPRPEEERPEGEA